MTSQSRHQRVDRGRVEAHLSVRELWLRYLSLTGLAGLVEVDAYLHGAYFLGSDQEDMLCMVVNEELEELYQAARLPCTGPVESTPVAVDPLDVLYELLEQARGHYVDTTDDES